MKKKLPQFMDLIILGAKDKKTAIEKIKQLTNYLKNGDYLTTNRDKKFINFIDRLTNNKLKFFKLFTQHNSLIPVYEGGQFMNLSLDDENQKGQCYIFDCGDSRSSSGGSNCGGSRSNKCGDSRSNNCGGSRSNSCGAGRSSGCGTSRTDGCGSKPIVKTRNTYSPPSSTRSSGRC